MAGNIKEIARLANVSRGTVDRVLHDRYGVSEEARRKVNEVIKELNYQPNVVAKALQSLQSPITLGVVLPPSNIEFFHEVARGFQTGAENYKSYGVTVLQEVLEVYDVCHWKKAVERLLEKDIKGLITIGIDTPEACEYLERMPQRPDVVIYNTDLDFDGKICFVGQDNYASGKAAGSLMGRIMKQQGKIFTVMAPLSKQAGILRYQGFQESIQKQNGTLELMEPVITGENLDYTYKVVKEALEKHSDISGVFINDSTVIAAADAIEESGRGNEISVISFDLYSRIHTYLDKGIIDYTITQEPFYQGYIPIQILYEKIVMGKMPKRKNYYTMIDIRCKENQYYENISTFYES